MAIRAAQLTGCSLPLLAALRALRPDVPLAAVAGRGAVVGAVGLSAYLVATFHPRTPLLAIGSPRLVVRVPALPGPPTVALTFDDGPHPETTPRILDQLGARAARATFFFVGERAMRFPDLVRRTAAEGHAIGIHGFRHRNLVLPGRKMLRAELCAATDAIESALGAPMPASRLLRPPYGFKTATLAIVAAESGFRVVAWSLNARDYAHRSSEGAIIDRIERRMRPGDIVLLHERPDRSEAFTVIPRVLDICERNGWRAAAIPPLLPGGATEQ
jgi:peptidoglycan/xylan/chitin deacetylase (PgdA/CDA1 family)